MRAYCIQYIFPPEGYFDAGEELLIQGTELLLVFPQVLYDLTGSALSCNYNNTQSCQIQGIKFLLLQQS